MDISAMGMVPTNISKQKSYSPAEILLNFGQKSKVNDSGDDPNSSPPINRDDKPNVGSNSSTKSAVSSSKRLKTNASDLLEILNGNNKRKTFMITLKLPKLKPKPKPMDETRSLIVKLNVPPKKPKISIKDSSHPFFKDVFKRMNTKNINGMTENAFTNSEQTQVRSNLHLQDPLSFKQLPKPDRNTFNQKDLSDQEKEMIQNLNTNFKAIELPSKSHVSVDLTFNILDFLLLYTIYKDHQEKIELNYPKFQVTIDTQTTAHDILNSKYGFLKNNKRFNKFFNNEYTEAANEDKITQWCNLYNPTNHFQCLQKQMISNNVFNWLSTSFSNLKKVDQFKRREKLKKKKNNVKELDPFIVYSDDEDSENEDHSTNVPSLIIEGPVGSGKTSMIHSIVDSELGGHVFEINSTQSRAKKEIVFHLKQIGTTSLVKNQKHNNDNTVILLDDVDLIDEELDKDFWSGVTDLLSYSYRPVIFTTTDISKIPINIVDESTVYRFNEIPKGELIQYLDMLALSRSINIDEKILDQIASTNLRQSLMNLQMFSYFFEKSNVGLTSITVIDDEGDGNVDTNNESNLSDLQQLKKHQLDMELQYYTEKLDRLNPFSYKDEQSKEEEQFGGKMDSKFQTEKLDCIQFYSSKYYSNGSRSRICKYLDGEDYMKKNPVNSFNTLSRIKTVVEVLTIIREMASVEYFRAVNNNPRRFEDHPADVFDDL